MDEALHPHAARMAPGDTAHPRDCEGQWREIVRMVFGGYFGEHARFEALMDRVERGRAR